MAHGLRLRADPCAGTGTAWPSSMCRISAGRQPDGSCPALQNLETAVELEVLALYPLVINALRGQPGVSLRKRRHAVWTQVKCLVERRTDGRCFARPHVPTGSEVGRPTFRLRIEVPRGRQAQRDGIAIPLQPSTQTRVVDPEQRVLAPIFVSPEKVLFEFQRADVLFVGADGRSELRFAAIDVFSGEVGTQTLWRFDTKFVSLITRCEQHVGGLTDIFPQGVAEPVPPRKPVPRGGAHLTFRASEADTRPNSATPAPGQTAQDGTRRGPD
jgi:hypothetical protein